MAAKVNSPKMPRPATATGRDKSLATAKIITLAIVAAVIIGECVAAYFLLPRGSHGAEARNESADDRAAARQVDLGKFNLTTFDPHANCTLSIDFHLVGAVAAQHSPSEPQIAGQAGNDGAGNPAGVSLADETKTFGHLLNQSKDRFREQVIEIIAAHISDLTDPDWGLIKRQIVARTNRLLDQPLLKEVEFTDFAIVQQ